MQPTMQSETYADFEDSIGYLDTVPKAQITPSSTLLRMVGTGTVCAHAGDPVPMVCPGCGHEIQIHRDSCGRVCCPVCWRTWARRAAERSAARIVGYGDVVLEQKPTRSRCLPRHITFDVPSVDFNLAKKKALKLGFIGGMLVLHPWRIKPEYQNHLGRLSKKTGKNRYELGKELEMEGTEVFYYSPHAHLISYGRGVDVQKGSDEYLYRVLRICKSLDDVEALAFYLLSHTFVPEPGKRVVRYFGCCSTQRLKPAWISKKREMVRCPLCGEPMVYPGTQEIKEISHYCAGGWKVVVPRSRLKAARLKADLELLPPLPYGLTDLV